MTRRRRFLPRAVLAGGAALLAASAPADLALSDALALRGGARAYWSSAYVSSTGSWKYDAPVLEQVVDLVLDAGPYGFVSTDAWLFSDVSGTCQETHRRAFSCYEGTLLYGYDFAFDEARKYRLKTAGGILWDWYGGYANPHDTPIYYQAVQSFGNPYLTPYWNLLGGPFTSGDHFNRIRIGVERSFKPLEKLSLTPSADVSWGDSNRYLKNYGERPETRIFGGAFMFARINLVAKWHFTDHLFLWGRYRHFFTLGGQARDLLRNRTKGPTTCDYPIFSLGLGVRF